MALAQNALTTVDALKLELKIPTSDTSLDKLLERKINAYSDFLEGKLGRTLGKNNYVEKYPGNNRQILQLNQWPIININSITQNFDGSDALLDASAYESSRTDKLRGWVFKENGWTCDSYLVGYVGEPTAPRRTITVDYDAGYVLPRDETTDTPRTLPYDIEELVLGIIASDYSQYGTQGLKSFGASDVKWEWNDGLKKQYQMILDKYSVRRV